MRIQMVWLSASLLCLTAHAGVVVHLAHRRAVADREVR